MTQRCRYSFRGPVLILAVTLLLTVAAAGQAPRKSSAPPPLTGAKAITRADLAKNPDELLKGRKVALLVGISDYKEEITKLPNLNYTIKDMMEVAQILKQQGYVVSLLQESEATATNIRTRIKNLSTMMVKPDESTLLFYFSGHGFAVSKDNYLATYGATMNNLQEQGLAVAELYDLLEQSGVRQRMAILDACRNDPNKKSAVAGRSIEKFERARGTKILFSTAPGQYSYEEPQWKQGLFTHFFLEGLQGSAAASDGLISWTDLVTYVESKMADFSASDGNRIQVPYSTGESSGDFLLARRADTSKLSPPPTDQHRVQQSRLAISPVSESGTTRAADMLKESTITSGKDQWLSSIHPNEVFQFGIDESTIYVYSGTQLLGTLVGKIDKKSQRVKSYEGMVRIHPASECPAGQGRMTVTEITPNQIRARIERPIRGNDGRANCGGLFGLPLVRLGTVVETTFAKMVR